MGRRDEDEDRGSRRSRDDDRDERRSSRDDDRGSSRRSRDDDDRDSRRSRDDDDRGSRRSRDDDDRGSSRRGRDDGDSGYSYEKRDADKTRERGSKGAHDYDSIVKKGIKMWRPNDGDNRIRILPPTWKDPKPEHYGLDVYVHYGVGADRGSYLCLHKMLGKDDPIHEAREEVKRDPDYEGNKDLEKYAKDLEAKRRVGVWIIDRDHEKEGPQFWAMPWTMDRDIIQVMSDKRTGEVLNIDDPQDGYDVEFTKKGSKDRTEYIGVAIARRPSELGESKWLKYAVENPIPEILQYYDYDHIAKAFGGKGAQKSNRDRDDRDDDRRGKDRDDDRRSSRDDDRRSSRDDDRRSSRDRDDDRRSHRKDDEPTWDSVHSMTKSELVDLIEEKKLDINPKEAKDTEDLADWVCEELKLKKAKPKEDDERPKRSRDDTDDDKPRRSRDDTDDDRPSRRRDDVDEKFDDMRKRRERD
jgi:hypothetical protein